MELTAGELFVVAFITVAVLSAGWWARLGEAFMVAISGRGRTGDENSDKGRDEARGE